MEIQSEQTLKRAMSGDIKAFQTLYSEFQNQLKSYLYRLVADRFNRPSETLEQSTSASVSLVLNYVQRHAAVKCVFQSIVITGEIICL